MPFPFWWIGALTAGLFLGAVFATFGILFRLLSRTTNEVRDSVLPGLVSGFRDWADGRPVRPRPSSPSAPAAGAVIDDASAGASTATQPLRRR